MSNTPIDLADPIWEQQEEEETEYYLIFARYYLPFALSGAGKAFRRYQAMHKAELDEVKNRYKSKENTGTNRLSSQELKLIKGVDIHNLTTWVMWERKYHWKKRHQAYHLYKAANDLEKLERRQSIQMARIANLVDTSIDRAEEIINMPSTERQVTQVDENGNPLVIILQPRDSKAYRDAMEILKAGQSLLEDYGVVGKANRYIKFLHDHGFEVTEAGVLPASEGAKLIEPAEESGELQDEYD